MKKIGALIMALLMLPMALVSATASGHIISTSGNVHQTAQIVGGGGGTPPEVDFVWVLPDERNRAGTQLDPALSSERNDIYACVVARDDQGRDDVQQVFVDVFHPQGTQAIAPCVASAGTACDDHNIRHDADGFKYQVHAVKLDPVADRQEIEDCKLDAKNAGLITQSEFDQINYNIFSQPIAHMYKVYLPMLYHQPAGDYRVEAWATDTASAFSNRLINYFEWVSTVALELDFTTLDYGVIQPSVFKVIQGDYDLGTPNAPTFKNEGNEPIKISLQTTTLEGANFEKEITLFDVKWDPLEIGFGHGYQEFGNDTMVYLNEPLVLCNAEKIDFSVHADVGLPADDYSGTLTIYAEADINP